MEKMERPNKKMLDNGDHITDICYWASKYIEEMNEYADYLESKFKNHGGIGYVSGAIPSLVDLSNIMEESIEVADSSTGNWCKSLQNHLNSKGYAIVKTSDR